MTGWDVSHLFDTPLYYIWDMEPRLCRPLDLWTMSRRDWDGAVDTYMGLFE